MPVDAQPILGGNFTHEFYHLDVTASGGGTTVTKRIQVVVTVLASNGIVYAFLSDYVTTEGGETVKFRVHGTSLNADLSLSRFRWSGRGGAPTYLLDRTDIEAPTFTPPDNVNGDTDYQYRATVTHPHLNGSITNHITVTVRDIPGMQVACASPAPVYEGAPDFLLTCTPQNTPDDVSYSWTSPSAPADTSLLSATDIPSPMFDVPPNVDADTDYEYLLTASAPGENDATATVTVTVLNRVLAITCTDTGYETYEGSAGIAFDCAASGAAPGADIVYSWTSPGAPADTSLLSATDIASPEFDVPDNVDSDTDYEYLLTATAEHATAGAAQVTVTVKNRVLAITCTDTGYETYEGSAGIAFDCAASGAAPGADIVYSWTSPGAPADTSLLSATDIASPEFDVPDNVDSDTDYEYLLTATAEHATAGAAQVTVTVKNRIDLRVACLDYSFAVYEGDPDARLFDCVIVNVSSDGATYKWTPRGSTPDVSLLNRSDVRRPLFLSSGLDVPSDTTFEYTLTVSRAEAVYNDGTAEVSVTVLNKSDLSLSCTNPRVHEGSENISLSCSASGAPSGSSYSYAWEARGDTPDVSLLDNPNAHRPLFLVPDEVPRDTTFSYALTASATGAHDATAEVTVTVLDRASLGVVCTYADEEVYEGAEDFEFDCLASGGAPGASYSYAWEASGDTPDTALLSATDVRSPLFIVPDVVSDNEIYSYTVTASAAGANDATAEVTVTVLNKQPLIVACAEPPSVYEGTADITLSCEASGAPLGSADEYVWEARGDTPDTALLSATDIVSPTFYVPNAVDEDKTYEYRLTARAENAEDGSADITVTVLNKEALALTCTASHTAYEGSEDITLACSASGAPQGSSYAYAWTPRGDTQDTALLSRADVASPTFAVPNAVDEDKTYEYRLTASAENAIDAAAEITVTVLNRKTLTVFCAVPASVYEGAGNVLFDCSASGAPQGSSYAYAWTTRGDTQDTDMDMLSAADIASPTFSVPDEVDEDKTYEYALTVSATGADIRAVDVTLKVLDRGALTIACTMPLSAYEGSGAIAFDCSASGAPGDDPDYTYAWTARGDTPDTALLSAADIASPTFYVPVEVVTTTTYEYLLTVSAQNAEDAGLDVAITVLNKGALSVACADPGSVYESSADIALDCEASGAPGDNPEYAYVWTARGDTPDTALLSAADVPSPMFYVPDEVDGAETYEYLFTASAANADDASVEVAVTVLKTGALLLACSSVDSVYEGSADIALDCEASGAPSGSSYTYAWTARGDTPDTALLSATDIESPTFYVPDEVIVTTTYEYLLTASAQNADDATARIAVTVLDKEALALTCTASHTAYENSEDIALSCAASGAPSGSSYAYAWTARGDTPDTALLSATNIASPTFHVPDNVDADKTYEYLLTASAQNADDATAEVTVTILNKRSLTVFCAVPASVYEGAADVLFDCSASGAPGDSPAYRYAWAARGDTPDTALLSAADIASPTFSVPDEVDEDRTYEYALTVSAEYADARTLDVTLKVLDQGALAIACTIPLSVYEGSGDVLFDCSASGAPGDSPAYAYAWTSRGDTRDTALLSAVDIASPTFSAPDEVDETKTYEYLLTVSAANADAAGLDVAITVLDKEALSVACADPDAVYEGSADVALDCEASGAPGDSPAYAYAWTSRGDTRDTALLSAADIASPTFYVPAEVDTTTTYEYLLTVSAQNADAAKTEVAVTVLNKSALAVACTDPGSVYEGSADIALDCAASGAPGDSPEYAYIWTSRGDTRDTALLSASDIASPTFYVPAEVAATTTYEYLLSVSATNAEGASAEVTVTVLDRAPAPDPVAPDPVAPDPVTPDPVAPPAAAQVPEPEPAPAPDPGLTVSASPLRFGVQFSGGQTFLDPATDRISTRIEGPYHAGRMTLAPGGGEGPLAEAEDIFLSVELVSPVLLRHEDMTDASALVLSPSWSLAESCEQLSSQSLEGLYTELTFSEADCRLLLFGGELDLAEALPGRYAGAMDVILRRGETEETRTVEVDVTVTSAHRTITIGPGGVRFGAPGETPVGLTEEQNLSIYPDMAFLTEETPDGSFELSNPSLVPLEVSVSARFGYTEATEEGREVVVEDMESSRLGDLSQAVNVFPSVLVLQPGEEALVRYGVDDEALASMSEQGYAAFFDITSYPRQYVDQERLPEEVSEDRTARVTMRVPGVYVPGEGASQLQARLLSLSDGVSKSAVFLVETTDLPFVGEVVAYDGEDEELGRRQTLIYTRSRVRVPLHRIPEEGSVFLRFVPREADRTLEPAAVEWDEMETNRNEKNTD